MILSVQILAADLASKVISLFGKNALDSLGLAGVAALGLAGAVAAIGEVSVKTATDFETQFARISGLTGSSAQMVDFYKQKVLELSPSWDMSATAAAKA